MSLSKLCTAVSECDYLKVERALQNGENPNSFMPWDFTDIWSGKCKKTPVLIVAINKLSIDIINLLLETPAIKVDLRGDFRTTPLAYATAQGLLEIVKKLLDVGASVNSRDTVHGGMPIHVAASNNNILMMQILQEHGSSLESLNANGSTPLLIAAFHGRKDVAQWLYLQGVDIKFVNNNGKSAIDMARSTGKREFENWFVSLKPINNISQVPQENKKVYILNFIDFQQRAVPYCGVNTRVPTLNKREGASIDSQNLSSTFKRLGYDVNLHENKTADQINIILDYIQQDQGLKSLLLIILSHGQDEETFYTSDGLTYSLRSIQQRFSDSGCPQLKGLSKVILANFCRGNGIEEMLASQAYIHRDFNQTDSVVPAKEPPHNMVTIYASHGGFAAKRDTKKGTAFVHNLCEVLKGERNQSVQDVFNNIYERMKQYGGQTPEMKVSPPFVKFNF